MCVSVVPCVNVCVCVCVRAGEVLRGDRIVNTPYSVLMNQDRKCEEVCSRFTLSLMQSKLVAERIQEEYYIHL